MYEYPFGNGQQLNLDWFLAEWKNLLAAWDAEKNGIEGALQAEIDRAEAALADVFAARDAAAQSAANALESKNAAAQSASDASGYLATVRADANTASNAARNAAQSESNAADSAQTAVASKNAAGQSEANANSSKNAAAQSASDADASKSAAAQSAADAAESKDAAAQSAEDASDAAASVEASAEQIATNANDIRNLKESINNIPFSIGGFSAITIAQGDYSYNTGRRIISKKKNYLKCEKIADQPLENNYKLVVLSGVPRWVSTSTSSYEPILNDLLDINYLKANTAQKIKLYSFVKDIIEPNSSDSVLISIIFAQVENDNITKLNTLSAVNNIKTNVRNCYSETVITIPDEATHFSLVINFKGNNVTSENVFEIDQNNGALALALSN